MINHAIKQALKSRFNYKLGAVIVKGGRVLGCGHNETGRYTNKWKQSWPGSLHAEEAAILNALRKGGPVPLVGSTLYVSRVGRNGEVGIAKPCKHCQEVIKSFHIKEVVYTTPDGVAIMEC